MPRVRLHVPVELELTPEAAKTARAAVDLAAAVVDSDVVGAARDLGRALRDAWRARRPRTVRPDR